MLVSPSSHMHATDTKNNDPEFSALCFWLSVRSHPFSSQLIFIFPPVKSAHLLKNIFGNQILFAVNRVKDHKLNRGASGWLSR